MGPMGCCGPLLLLCFSDGWFVGSSAGTWVECLGKLREAMLVGLFIRSV